MLTDEDLAALKKGLEQERDCYETILDLSREQLAVLEGQDPGRLMAILAKKQAVMAIIDSIDGKIGPLKDAWKDARDSVDGAARASIQGIMNATADVLQEIVATENTVTEGLESKKSEKAEEIGKLQQGKKLHKAYRIPPEPTSRYKDEKK